jgi:phospholipase C
MKLPAYTFLEPRFIAERLLRVHHSTDYHPPHNVQHAEKFLVDVYNAVRSSPYRDRILLIVTFDEHGGTYDHVPPPNGAAPPEPTPIAKNGFKFDRFGVRTPAIVVSSWVKPGTVFRAAPGTTPYDHTSVLATLRDWKQIPAEDFLPSPRIAAAPTLHAVLTESVPNEAWPDITALWNEGIQESLAKLAAPAEDEEALLEQPPDDLEQSIVAATDYYLRFQDRPPEVVEAMAKVEAIRTVKAETLPTKRAAMEELRRMMLNEE